MTVGLLRDLARAAAVATLASASPLLGAAGAAEPRGPAPPIAADRLVYSAEEKISFDLFAYLAGHAPHLLPYEEAISHWCGFTTISPRIALALIELQSGLVTAERPDPALFERPLGALTREVGFARQLESVLTRLTAEAYRLHSPAASPDAGIRTRAATDAVAALLAGEGGDPAAAELAVIRFVSVHAALFPEEAPLSRPRPPELAARAAPRAFLQLPYPLGEAWTFSGAHPFGHDGFFRHLPLSSMDYASGTAPADSALGGAVVASHPGRVKVHSSCFVEVLGEGGWSTSYYHLDGVAVADGEQVSRNQLLAYEAVDRDQGICNGGRWTSPHVHFTLLLNGQYTTLHGSELSGWRVRADRSSQGFCGYTWLTEGSRELCPGTRLPNEGFLRRLEVVRTGHGGGVVTSSPAGIDCGGRCKAAFPQGTRIELTATSAPGSAFAGWSGPGCSGTAPCRLVLESSRAVTARFEEDDDPFLATPEIPGFRIRVRISSGDVVLDGRAEADCIPETLCVSGALPGRSEVFVRIVGPRPNGYLWPTLVKFTTSRVDVWIEQTRTGAVRHYVLEPAPAGGRLVPLEGLVDRTGFEP